METEEESKMRQLEEWNRQITVLMGNLNEIDKTISRIRNEVLELNPEIADKLNSKRRK